MAFSSIPMNAGGQINVATFVKLSAAADFTVLAAGAGDPVFGVASENAEWAPIPSAPTYAATTGEPVQVYPIGCLCLITVGSGGLTAGDYVKSDASGNAVTATISGTSAINVGGRALESANAGELARILVWPQSITPT